MAEWLNPAKEKKKKIKQVSRWGHNKSMAAGPTCVISRAQQTILFLSSVFPLPLVISQLPSHLSSPAHSSLPVSVLLYLHYNKAPTPNSPLWMLQLSTLSSSLSSSPNSQPSCLSATFDTAETHHLKQKISKNAPGCHTLVYD